MAEGSLMPCPSSVMVISPSRAVISTLVAPDLRAFWRSSFRMSEVVSLKNWETLLMASWWMLAWIESGICSVVICVVPVLCFVFPVLPGFTWMGASGFSPRCRLVFPLSAGAEGQPLGGCSRVLLVRCYWSSDVGSGSRVTSSSFPRAALMVAIIPFGISWTTWRFMAL